MLLLLIDNDMKNDNDKLMLRH